MNKITLSLLSLFITSSLYGEVNIDNAKWMYSNKEKSCVKNESLYKEIQNGIKTGKLKLLGSYEVEAYDRNNVLKKENTHIFIMPLFGSGVYEAISESKGVCEWVHQQLVNGNVPK